MKKKIPLCFVKGKDKALNNLIMMSKFALLCTGHGRLDLLRSLENEIIP